jgi:phosphonate transport system permease protein
MTSFQKFCLLMLKSRQTAVRLFGAIAFLCAMVLSIQYTRFDPISLIAEGQDLALFVTRIFPPDFSELNLILELGFESLWIALLGTFMGLSISLPVAVYSARSTAAPAIFRQLARGIIVSTRAIPGLVFALLFVQILGPGPTAGILALGMNSIGMMGKLISDAIDTLDQSPVQALSASGASRTQVFFAAVVPQLFPAIVSTTLHRLDINFRYSAILGLVGAGGIGLYLQYNIIYFEYQDALAAVVVIVLAVLLIETISGLLRRYFMSPRVTSKIAAFTSGAILFATSGILFLASASVEISWNRFVKIPSGIAKLVSDLVPPDFITYQTQLFEGTLQSMTMALVSTFFGAILAVPLGFLGARNLHGMAASGLARGISQLVRGVPDLILALFLVAALGLGPATGTLVLCIGTLGFLTKFVADSLEEIDTSSYQALIAAGATKFQAVYGAIIPAARSIISAHVFYALDINFRLSALMGIVGAGGIGAVIITSVQAGDFETASAALIIVFVCVVAIESLSRWAIRK